jgi:antitoxin CptB
MPQSRPNAGLLTGATQAGICAIYIPRDHPLMAPSKDAGEELSMRLRRLRYRAWHRGTREMDLILGPYADAKLPSMPGPELDRFEALLEELDTDLFDWLMGNVPTPPTADHQLLADLLAFKTAS